MAGPYYCDLAGTYADVTALTGAKGSGPGGLQAIIRGTGNATALAAGEICYVKGTGNLTRLVKLTCGKDVSGWSLGDTVVDNAGGATWGGLVCELSVGANTAVILVELDIGDDEDLIVLANGINNTTATDTTTLSAKSCDGIQIDTNIGDLVDGNIKLIGVNAAWADDGTESLLDADGDATYCIHLLPGRVYYTLKNLGMINATSHGLNATSGTGYHNYIIIQHCRIEDNGSYGYYGNDTQIVLVRDCVFRGNGDNAIHGKPSGIIVRDCVIANNTGWGVWDWSGKGFVGNLVYGNGSGGLQSDAVELNIANNVFDGNDGDGIEIDVGQKAQGIFNNRITNNAGFGINMETAVADSCVEDYNVIFNNTLGARDNIVAGDNSDDAPADDGYTKRTILITYDAGTNMNNASVGDTVTDGTWSGKVRTEPTGAATGTFEADTFSAGNPANDDTMTLGGVETGTVNGTPTIVETGANATDYNIKSGAEIRNTAYVLNWDQ